MKKKIVRKAAGALLPLSILMAFGIAGGSDMGETPSWGTVFLVIGAMLGSLFVYNWAGDGK